MSTAKINTFITELEQAGVVISNAPVLAQRLCSASNAEDELVKIAVNSKASGVSFQVDVNRPADKLSQAFKNAGFDGFTFGKFVSVLKPLS